MTPLDQENPENENIIMDENEEIIDVIPLDDAGLEMIADDKDDSVSTIPAHMDDVLRIEVAHSRRWLVTGSMDDTAAVWDCESDFSEPYFRLQHLDSVEYVAFNRSDTLLASGDLKGLIRVTSLADKRQIYEIQDFVQNRQEDDGEILHFLLWHPIKDILIAGNDEGIVWSWSIAHGGVIESKIFSCATISPVTSAKFISNTSRLLVIHQDGWLRNWDLETSAKNELNLGSSCPEYTSLDVHSNSHIAAISLADGSIALVNLNQNKMVARLGEAKKKEMNDNSNDESQEITAIAFCPTNQPWLAVGRVNGSLVIYDFNSRSVRATIDHEANGIVSLIWNRMTDGIVRIISGDINGTIRIIDARNGHISKTLLNGSVSIFDMAIVEKPNEPSKLVQACSDSTVKIFAI